MKERKLKRAVIKEEFVKLTGDMYKAVILNQFLYWSERVYDFDKFIKEERERMKQEGQELNMQPTHGWIYKKAEELIDETMLGISAPTMGRHLKALVEMGYLWCRNNPDHPWDRTKQYRVNFKKVRKDLAKLGYTLEEYPMFTEDDDANFTEKDASFTMKDGDCNMKDQDFTVQDQTSQNERAITENNTEITSETTTTKTTTTKNNNKKKKKKKTEDVVVEDDVVVVVDAQTERVKNEIEARLRVNIKSLVGKLKEWIDEYGEDRLLKVADYIASREWDNPVGAFRSAVEEEWPIENARRSVSSVDTSLTSGGQYDERYAAFYQRFPDASTDNRYDAYRDAYFSLFPDA